MANEKNLIPINKRTKSEQRKIASSGGKASGESRRRKKTLKQAMLALLEQNVTDELTKALAADMGINTDDFNYQLAIVAAMVREAATGNVKAFAQIRNLIGEDTDSERLELQKKEYADKKKTNAGEGRLNELIAGLTGENDDLHE